MTDKKLPSKLPDTLEELNIKHLRLMNGDSIISYIHETKDSMVGLEMPMLVTTSNEAEHVLTPYMPFNKGAVHMIDSYSIILECPVDIPVKANYMKMVLDMKDGTARNNNDSRLTMASDNTTIH